MDLKKTVTLEDYLKEEFEDILVGGPVAQIYINESRHKKEEGIS